MRTIRQYLVYIVNPLSANPTKWSNKLKKFVGKLPTNFLNVIEHFVGLTLKGLIQFSQTLIDIKINLLI